MIEKFIFRYCNRYSTGIKRTQQKKGSKFEAKLQSSQQGQVLAPIHRKSILQVKNILQVKKCTLKRSTEASQAPCSGSALIHLVMFPSENGSMDDLMRAARSVDRALDTHAIKHPELAPVCLIRVRVAVIRSSKQLVVVPAV